ncbi:MAG: PIN domain-containing protein [Pseudonocardia sp.]|nr:PIN domain-containing protein [Pseudonocardia sp.]
MVLDTTVLVYSVGDQHRFQEPCRRLLSAAGAGTILCTTTPEVLQEFAHIRARRRTRADAAELAESFTDLLGPLLTIDERGLRAGLRTFRAHPPLGAFDAVLIATAITAGATAVVSADSAFADVTGIRHIVPDSDGVAELIRS